MLIRVDDNLFDIPQFRNKVTVFRDRENAGEILSQMLAEYKSTDAIVFAIPAGGVPVGAVVATELHIPLEVAIVSKITLPWNTEAGYGAVAFDGTVRLNEEMVSRVGLTQNEIEEGIVKTRDKIRNRIASFRSGRSSLQVSGRTVILVDDGIASGFTMTVAVEALKKAGAIKIVIAVPTAHLENIQGLVQEVDELYCANIRSGWSFAVADAYELWTDVSEEEVIEILKGF